MKMLWAKQVALCGLLLLGSYSAQGQDVQDLINYLKSAQVDISNAGLNYRQASPDDALLDLADAQTKLIALENLLYDPVIEGALGTSLTALRAKVATCRLKVDEVFDLVDPESELKAKPAKAVAAKICSCGKLVATTENGINKGRIAGKLDGSEKLIIAPQGDVFNYKAGKTVKFKVYPPGYPNALFPAGGQPPSIVVNNLDICNSLDENYYVWTLSPDRKYYTLELLMGPKEGPSHFELTYNGQTTEQLVMNRGGPGAASMPYGFPTYMQTGNYQMGMSMAGTSWWTDSQGRHSGSVSVPYMTIPYTIYLQNLRSFANMIVKMFNQIAPALLQGSGITSVAATCTSSTDTRVVLTFSARFGDGANGGFVNVSIIMSHI